MNRLLSLLVLATLVLAAYGAQNTDPFITIMGVLRDQSDVKMRECAAVGGNGKGSAGEANGGLGFPNTDFQMDLGSYEDNEKGLVGKECNNVNGWGVGQCGRVGLDRTPVYAHAGRSPGKNVGSPASFYKWFHDSNQTRNVQYTITLNKNRNGIYQYSNTSQFPLDGRGWKDYCADDENPKKNHNYGYCWETHFSFGYQGGETFDFTGDDDVWVYIDEKLVIDLGSLHTELSQSIAVDSIPNLQVGKTYKFDFFYCERHTTESNMKISTSLAAYCTYNDWCGVCEGNGQSCCRQELVDQFCDDKNLCSTESCGIVNPPDLNGCVYTWKNCSKGDKCNLIGCNPLTGNCETTKVVCNDTNLCTSDSCDVNTGCKFTAKNCDDSNKCTTDSCSATTGNCVNAPISCNDNNACTIDSCNPSTGCVNQVITCPIDGCTSSKCESTIGCVNTTKICNDNNACTDDTCIRSQLPDGCSFRTKSCDDNNKCTKDECLPASGCSNTAINCNDNNPCTNDTCSASTGCTYQPIPCLAQKCKNVVCLNTTGCAYTDVTCNDNNPCTKDSCDANSGQCSYTPLVCNDNSLCTTDKCEAGKCIFTPVICTDTDKCTDHFCTNSTGCGTTPVSCDDEDDCTLDKCDPATGCSNTPINCDDGSQCTIDTCKKVGGCQNTKRTCNDNDACTDDTCVPTLAGGCKFTPKVCNDGNFCTDDSCNKTTGCVYATKVCDDGNLCTADSCDPASGCKVATIPCDDENKCTTDICLPTVGCTSKAVDCASGDPCITGKCNAATGSCTNTSIADCSKCTPPNVVPDCSVPLAERCFPKICDPLTGGCKADLPVYCNDSSACTKDTCTNGVCAYTAINCDDGNPCTRDSCDKTSGCKNEPIVCNDKSVCTNDTCVGGVCVYTPFLCTDGKACTIDTCNATTGCIFTDVECDDNNKCTNEVCNTANGNCTYTPVNCNDGKVCTIDTCIPATGCVNTDKICDDSNACTSDSCPTTGTGNCTFVPLNCTQLTSANKCDIVSCDKNNGCAKTAKVCDDNNPCTTDSCNMATGDCSFVASNDFCLPCGAISCSWVNSCNPKICINTTNTCQEAPVACDDGSACTTDKCIGTGAVAKCEYTAISCPTTDLCSPSSCDTKIGCVNTTKVCDDGSRCTDDSCVAGSCVFTPKVCDTSNPCNPQSCDLATGTCSGTPKLCDDSNLCTVDSCNATGDCEFILKSCTSNPCEPQVCEETTGNCVANPLNCDDGNPCTIDTVICVNNLTPNCSYTSNLTICDDHDPCTEDICDSSVAPGMNPCRNTSVICPAVSPCYIDLGCVPFKGCDSAPRECVKNSTEANSTSDFCVLRKCDPAVGCVSENRVCPNKDIGCYDAFCNNVTRACELVQKDGFSGNFGKGGVICPLLYNSKIKTAAISAGAVAGIVIGCVAAAAIIGFGGKAGYDFLMAKNSPMGPVASNPLYTQAATAGTNALYGGSG